MYLCCFFWNVTVLFTLYLWYWIICMKIYPLADDNNVGHSCSKCILILIWIGTWVLFGPMTLLILHSLLKMSVKLQCHNDKSLYRQCKWCWYYLFICLSAGDVWLCCLGMDHARFDLISSRHVQTCHGRMPLLWHLNHLNA